MSDPNNQSGTQVDPSEGPIEEGEEQGAQSSEAEGEESLTVEVDPSEGPTE